MIIDAEMIQMMIAFLKPLEISDDAFGLDAMADVGPGGHFFGTAHTLARYETAFNPPVLADWSNYETWAEKGSLTADQRANKVYKALLSSHEEPAMDESVREELDAFVDRRIAEGGAGMDD
jgi:trimethylamine--corrinoid protein Co-methyltransferase